MTPLENQARLARACTREQAITLLDQMDARGKRFKPYIEAILQSKVTEAVSEPPEPGSTESEKQFVPIKCPELPF